MIKQPQTWREVGQVAGAIYNGVVSTGIDSDVAALLTMAILNPKETCNAKMSQLLNRFLEEIE